MLSFFQFPEFTLSGIITMSHAHPAVIENKKSATANRGDFNKVAIFTGLI